MVRQGVMRGRASGRPARYLPHVLRGRCNSEPAVTVRDLTAASGRWIGWNPQTDGAFYAAFVLYGFSVWLRASRAEPPDREPARHGAAVATT